MNLLIKNLHWLGLALLAFGLFYDIFFVNIPFQDAPLALENKWKLQKKISELTMIIGANLFLIGIILKLFKGRK